MLLRSCLAEIKTQWPIWKWNSGITEGKSGKDREWATNFGSTNYLVWKWSPNLYFWNVTLPFNKKLFCEAEEADPDRINLPAGDACTTNQECFTNFWNITSGNTTFTCSGKHENAVWTDDREWYPGMFWKIGEDKQSCVQTSRINQPWDAATRWEFGSLWANNIWVKFGTQKDGFRYNISDADLIPDPSTPIEPWMFRICYNFTGFNTNETSEGGNPILSWGGNLERTFTKYDRDIGDSEVWTYTGTYPDGSTYDIEEPAQWGYSNNGKHYWNTKRGYSEYYSQNERDRRLWSVPRPCHHRSTIKYWRIIMDDHTLHGAYNQFLTTEWITSGNNYAKVQGVDQCVGNAILETHTYWEVHNISHWIQNWYSIWLASTIIFMFLL